MLKIFTIFADWVTFSLIGLSPDERVSKSVHFFIEDTFKILFLIIVMIYSVAHLRFGLNEEKVRNFLQGRKKIVGHLLSSFFGAITPFCSCSSIPLVLGFVNAKIPVGMIMSFLITSPLINEVAVILLAGLLGIKFTIIYVSISIFAGVTGGMIIGLFSESKIFTKLAIDARKFSIRPTSPALNGQKTSFKIRHKYAANELKTIFTRIWKWVIIGVGIGSLFHGYVPEEFILTHLGDGKWWNVFAATTIGIPLYSNASGIIPIAESMITKGVPTGTVIAFMMSTVGASLPEFILLKQVFKTKFLISFFLMLLLLFCSIGLLFNLGISN